MAAFDLFLSSTVQDLHAYRLGVQQACAPYETACLLSEENWVGGYDDAVTKCQRRVQEANGFVLVSGYWYGSIPPGQSRSITHLEFDWAMARWGSEKFPPMAVFLPREASAAAQDLRQRADALLATLDAAEVDAHQQALRDFQQALTGSWRTVSRFGDKQELREHAIATSQRWRGQTALAAARGELHASQQQGAPQHSAQQVSDEQLGALGRSPQLTALRSLLAGVAACPQVPALCLLVDGDEDAGQRAFLQRALSEKSIRRCAGMKRSSRIPDWCCEAALLPAWVAQQLLPAAAAATVHSTQQLADDIAVLLKQSALCVVLDRIGDFPGGMTGFREHFWLPLYTALAERRATQQFSHRLLALVSDYRSDQHDDDGDGAAALAAAPLAEVAAGAAAAGAGKPPRAAAQATDYTRPLPLPRLAAFSAQDLWDWCEEMEIPDQLPGQPPGRRAHLVQRAWVGTHGVPTRVFERLQGEDLWPEGADQ